jgi:hypothetical protein
MLPNLRFIEGEGDGGSGGDIAGSQESGNVEGAGEGSLNPAWSPLLEKIPSSLHPMVTPHLREWDTNFDTQLQKVQSKYDPYKDILESGIEPQVLQQALGFYQLAESDPKRVFDEMAKFYGYGQDQGQQVQDSEDDPFGEVDDGEDIDPRLAQLQEQQEAIAKLLLGQHEQEQLRQAEAQIEAEVTEIKTEHPDMTEDEEIMMYRLATSNGSSLKDAAAELFKYKESISQSALQNQPHAPSVISSTGTLPGQPPIDPRKLDSKGTKDLVQQMLANRQ